MPPGQESVNHESVNAATIAQNRAFGRAAGRPPPSAAGAAPSAARLSPGP
jgi:hypothetical protein